MSKKELTKKQKPPQVIEAQTSIDTVDDTLEALGQEEINTFKKKSVSGAISYTLRSLVLAGVGILASSFLSVYLDPSAFGIYGLVAQVVSLLQFFSDVGLGPALIQQKHEPSISEYRTVFFVQQILAWILFAVVVLIALSGVLTPKVGVAGLWVMVALGLSLPLGSLKVIPAIILERKLDFSKLVIPAIFEQIVFNIVLIFMVVKGMGVISYAYALALRAVVGVVVMYVVQPWAIGFAFDRSVFKKIVHVGAKFQASDILARIKDNLYYLFLGFYLPLNEFGYINWAKQWSHYPYTLTVQNVIAITFPAYSRLQHDKIRLQKAIEKTVFFIALSIFPILTGMALFIQPLILVIPQFAKWQPAMLTFILFVLSIGWAAISTPLTNTLNAIGQVNTTLKLMIGWTSMTWILTPLFLRWFGFNGVAISAFVISFTSILPIYLVQKHVKVNIWGAIWRQLFSAVVMVVVGLWGYQIWITSVPHMFMGILIVGSSYLVSMAVIGRQKLVVEVQSLLNSRK